MADPVLAYNFDGDENWKNYFANLEFVDRPTEQLILKKKRTWYKRNIDPSYEPPASTSNEQPASSQTYTPPPNTSSYTSTSQSQGRSSYTSTTSGSSSSRSSTSLPPSFLQYARQNILNTVVLAGNLFILINAILYILPLFSIYFSHDSYRRAFKGALVVYLVALYRTYGKPQFNMQFFGRVMADDNAQYLLYAILFLLSAPMAP
eukprot:Colp12_sorted_trinity150504_noHs@18948